MQFELLQSLKRTGLIMEITFSLKAGKIRNSLLRLNIRKAARSF